MNRENRLKEIQKILIKTGSVDVEKLSQIFEVTSTTIRRDLNDLEKNKVVIRSHGGAILAPSETLREQPYNIRAISNTNEKYSIAKACEHLVVNDEYIFFDSSTTVYALSKHLTPDKNLVIVTDTMPTAMELNHYPQINVIFIGGELQKETNSCTGMFAEDMLKTMLFDKCFFGIFGITEEGYLTTSSTIELSIKKEVLKRSTIKIALLDNTKYGKKSFLEVCHISDIDIVVTDKDISLDFLKLCKEHNTRVIISQ